MLNISAIQSFAIWVGCLILLLSSLISCQKDNSKINIEQEVVASIGTRVLYQSELENVIHTNTSEQDSLALASAYTDQWIRDQLMAREAARFYSTDFETEKLVDDYREKLLRFKLEEQVVKTRFDTIISTQELSSIYEERKEQFLLSDDIYRGIYMKFGRKTAGLGDMSNDWKEDNFETITNFARAFAEEYHLDTLSWLTLSDLNGWYDGWSKSRADQHLKQRQRDRDYEYFLKIVEHKDKTGISPLEYIRPQLTRMLLHKRRQEILENYKQELYESALGKKQIKYHK